MNNYGNSVIYKIDMRYLNGKIYKLVSNVTGDVYYGSTCNSLKERLSGHKSLYKRYLEGKTQYYTSFKIIETGDYKIELVEKYSCLCRNQLEAIERVYIKGYVCINKHIPIRNHKVYNKNKQKEFYHKNKQKILNRAMKKFNCECGSTLRLSDKSRHYKTKKHQKYLNAT